MLLTNKKKQESAGSLHAFFVAAFPKLLVSFCWRLNVSRNRPALFSFKGVIK